VTSEFARPGSKIEIEMTVEAVRHRVSAHVAKTPFYNPKQKTATPV
jgi:glycine cleavage system aminomethyltransferase T